MKTNAMSRSNLIYDPIQKFEFGPSQVRISYF